MTIKLRSRLAGRHVHVDGHGDEHGSRGHDHVFDARLAGGAFRCGAIRSEIPLRMKISRLVEHLLEIQRQHGDIPVMVQTLTHTWAPEPTVKLGGERKWVLLNP